MDDYCRWELYPDATFTYWVSWYASTTDTENAHQHWWIGVAAYGSGGKEKFNYVGRVPYSGPSVEEPDVTAKKDSEGVINHN